MYLSLFNLTSNWNRMGKSVTKDSKSTFQKKSTALKHSNDTTTKFKLFMGNLSESVDVQMVQKAFGKFKSLGEVQVIPKKGYGFISFEAADDYLKAFKEMNGKIIGTKPITLKRAKSPIGKPKAGR